MREGKEKKKKNFSLSLLSCFETISVLDELTFRVCPRDEVSSVDPAFYLFQRCSQVWPVVPPSLSVFSSYSSVVVVAVAAGDPLVRIVVDHFLRSESLSSCISIQAEFWPS